MAYVVARRWGPADLMLTTQQAAESTWFSDHFAVDSHGPLPLPVSRFDIVTENEATAVFDTASAALVDTAPAAEIRRIRDENYRFTRTGQAATWTLSATRPADNSTPALAPHSFTRDATTWTVRHAGGDSTHRLSEVLARALVGATLAQSGATLMHASCAAATAGGEAILFTGSGEAGKTTLALHLCRTAGVFLAGDQTGVLAGPDGRWWAAGAALVPRLRWGTLTGLGLAEQVRGSFLRRYGARVCDLPQTPAKIVLTQREISDVLGVRTSDCAPLAAVAVVHREPDRPLRIRPLPPAEAAAALTEHVLVGQHAWLHPGLDSPAATAELAARLPVVEIRWDPARHPPADVLSQIALTHAAG